MGTSENAQKAKFSIAPAQRAQDRRRGSRIPRGIMVLMDRLGRLGS
jgi:hypothetical protein